MEFILQNKPTPNANAYLRGQGLQVAKHGYLFHVDF